jgi:hypothetical protein
VSKNLVFATVSGFGLEKKLSQKLSHFEKTITKIAKM